MNYKIEKKNEALLVSSKYSKDKKLKLLLMSDLHFDSKKCNRILLKRHLDEAKENGALIFMFGDIFDCMGGKYDKRTTKADIRPEYQTSTYFQDIVKDAAKFFEPYKDNIVLFADGNHETSVRLRHEIDLLDDLRLRLDYTEEQIFRGKYCGFIRFQFAHVSGGQNLSKNLYYTHGGGGSAPVTKNVIKSNRRQDAIEADLYVGGHTHTEFEVIRTQANIDSRCNLVVRDKYHWNLGCYKDEFGKGGWSDHKEFAPASIGSRWVEFYVQGGELIVRSYLAK